MPVGGGTARALTTGTHDSQARWSPEGKSVVFQRVLEKDGKPQPPQLFLIPMNGGEARQLTDMAKGAGDPLWSPDGRAIAFTSNTLPKDAQPPTEGQEESDVRVITRAGYRMNGAGYVDTSRPSHIWTV